MDRLPRFSISFYSCGMLSMMTSSTTSTTQVVRSGLENPQIRYHQAQQVDQDESISFRCNRKKAVSWDSSAVDNELTPKKSFQKEPYFAQVFEVNRESYMGLTAGSMEMKLVKRF
ncbi:unnamed protein product [Calypogeia fissa]